MKELKVTSHLSMLRSFLKISLLSFIALANSVSLQCSDDGTTSMSKLYLTRPAFSVKISDTYSYFPLTQFQQTPLALIGLSAPEKFDSMDGKSFSVDVCSTTVSIPSDDFDPDTMGAIYGSLDVSPGMIRTAESESAGVTSFELSFSSTFLLGLACFNSGIVQTVQACYEREILERFNSLSPSERQPYIDASPEENSFRAYRAERNLDRLPRERVTEMLTTLPVLNTPDGLARFAVGIPYSCNYFYDKGDDVKFGKFQKISRISLSPPYREGEQSEMLREPKCRLALSRLFVFYLFYKYYCAHLELTESQSYPLLSTLKRMITNFVEQLAALKSKTASWSWVPHHCATPGDRVVVPKSPTAKT